MAWLAGLPAMLAQVAQGDSIGIAWALFAGLGFAGIVTSVGAALTQDDPIRPQSVLWSVRVISLGFHALRHDWVRTDTALEKVERFTFAGAAHRPRRRDSAAGIRASERKTS